MASRRAGLLAATAQGALAGAFGGVAAGLLDYAFAAGGARQFLPDGTARLAVFLVGLYGAAAAMAGAVAGLAVAGLGRWTDLGALWRSAFGDEGERKWRIEGAGTGSGSGSGEGRRWVAYGVGAVGALVLCGVAVRMAALFALQRFHSPMLIAALVGVEAAGLGALAGIVGFALASLLSTVLRFGPRLRVQVKVAPALLVTAWAVGLAGGAAAVAQVVAALQRNRAMPVPLRALNAGIAAPLLVAGAVIAAHLGMRLLAPRLPRVLRVIAERPDVVLLVPVVLGALGGGALLVAAWPIAKLLPLRAVAVGLCAPLAAILLATMGDVRAAVARRGRGVLAALVVAVPVVLALGALQAGRADRVQKAAAIHAALTRPLVAALHAAWDVDRDGWSPVLGPDCNDLDADVHPGAFDWPDDGIDQNCNGHQATLAPAQHGPFAPLPTTVPQKPNFVLISVDALRWDHVGAYGYARPTTPRIDELAREGTLFANGWAHSPSTRYSVPAILTGRYESTIAWGSDHWPPTVLPENRLLPEMFKDQGYRTAAILPAPYFLPRQANAHMSMWGLDQGFDEYDTSLAPLHSHANSDPAKATGSSSKQLADLVVKWIGAHAAPQQERPFFLWMHFYDPHYLYEKHADSPAFGSSDIDLYDAEVRYTDTHIGRVLDALRAAGAWDKTVVILTADHGEGFGEHGVNQHGYHIYTAQNQVPFIVRVPGIAPRKVDEPVGHVDLFPSFLNLLGAPDEPQLLGRSFLDMMLNAGPQKDSPRLVFGEVDYEGPTQRKSVASRTHHLIANVVPDGTFEFYHLAADPLEAHDLFERGAGGEQGRLVSALGEWTDQSALPADFGARVVANVATQQFPFERALGADLGGLVTIDGVTLKTPSVRAGEQAEVELVMHVPAKVPEGWRLFTHAVGPTSRELNLDHDPVEGFVPLGRLRPGQWVRDRIRFTVPPTWRDPEVTLRVGLFRREGNRWKNADVRSGGSGDFVVAATMQVTR